MSKKVYKCYISGEEIPEARVEFLQDSGIPESEWTVVKHSLVKKKMGIFLDDDRTDFKVVSKVYNDSVRSVFRQAAEESDPEGEINEGEVTNED